MTLSYSKKVFFHRRIFLKLIAAKNILFSWYDRSEMLSPNMKRKMGEGRGGEGYLEKKREWKGR